MSELEANTGSPKLEVIVCSVEDAIEAELGGASRLEVISHFESGGLTPPLALVREMTNNVSLPLRVMLRESEGYRLVNETEAGRLCAAAREMSLLGVEGIVLGFLIDGEIDIKMTSRILGYAPRLKATFHHAFDDLMNPWCGIRALKTLPQVDRILTSGGEDDLALKIERLASYDMSAKPGVTILAGGGMDAPKIRAIRRATNIREYHVGRAARVPASIEGSVRESVVRGLVSAVEL